MPERPLIVVMAKDPLPGRVKTRLARDTGKEAAAGLYEAFFDDIVRESADPERWNLAVAHHPPAAAARFRALAPAADLLLPQRGADLTARMQGVLRAAFEHGAPVVMRNSDSPTLPRRVLAEALDRLAAPAVDIVLGPDQGGGYYLIGVKQPPPAALLPRRMSTSSVLRETRDRAVALGLAVELLEPHLDVDTPEDLERLRQLLADDAGARRRCRRTWQLLAGR